MEYVRDCRTSPNDECLFDKFFLVFYWVFFLGWAVFGAFYLYAAYRAIMECVKNAAKATPATVDV